MPVEETRIAPHEIGRAFEVHLRHAVETTALPEPLPSAGPDADAAELAHDRPGGRLQQGLDLALHDEHRVAADAVLERERAATDPDRGRRPAGPHADRDRTGKSERRQ